MHFLLNIICAAASSSVVSPTELHTMEKNSEAKEKEKMQQQKKHSPSSSRIVVVLFSSSNRIQKMNLLMYPKIDLSENKSYKIPTFVRAPSSFFCRYFPVSFIRMDGWMHVCYITWIHSLSVVFLVFVVGVVESWTCAIALMPYLVLEMHFQICTACNCNEKRQETQFSRDVRSIFSSAYCCKMKTCTSSFFHQMRAF